MKLELKGMLASLCTFTIVPMPVVELDEASFGRSLVWLGVPGAVVGLLWLAGGWLLVGLHQSGVDKLLCTVLAALLPWVLTGFIHLDGFMDCCDAILSRRGREDKLRILKDPACGPFSVVSFLAVAAVFVASVGGLLQLPKGITLFAAIPLASRSLAALALLRMPVLPGSSLARASTAMRKSWDSALQLLLLVVAFAAAGFFTGIWGALALGLAVVPFALALKRCVKDLGGVSGDVAGFLIVIFETAACAAGAILSGILA